MIGALVGGWRLRQCVESNQRREHLGHLAASHQEERGLGLYQLGVQRDRVQVEHGRAVPRRKFVSMCGEVAHGVDRLARRG